jgi:predicted small lipoprotein YifL
VLIAMRRIAFLAAVALSLAACHSPGPAEPAASDAVISTSQNDSTPSKPAEGEAGGILIGSGT